MIPKNTKSLLTEFRMSRGQSEETPPKPTEPRKKKRQTSGSSPYEIFYRKYQSLEDTIDSFGTRDLVYYFREIANEQGYKYTISNILMLHKQ